MLARFQRLNLQKFNAVIEKGRVYHSSLFLIRVLKDQKDLRIAAVTSKKVSKTAVGRNYMRRKIYEAIRPDMSLFRPGLHIIIFAKIPATTLKQIDLINDLKQIFVKAELLR